MGETKGSGLVISAGFEIKLPVLPNYLTLAGKWSETRLDVGELDEATLRALGAAWTEALVAHAKRRSPTNANPTS